MIHEVHAIYEHGILRPLSALDLPEATEVIVTLREVTSAKAPPADPILGLMADEPQLLDEVVEAAIVARESHPLRAAD
jgi:predicted DNA-binding antitoxin AbrB/MazE fold protein